MSILRCLIVIGWFMMWLPTVFYFSQFRDNIASMQIITTLAMFILIFATFELVDNIRSNRRKL
jgi:hypothetical protein